MQLKPLTPDEVADRVRTLEERLRPGLGDMVSAGLSAIGITKERVSKMLGRPCNCPQRQAALNELGRKFGIG